MICDLLALRPISHITKKTLSYLHSTKIEQMTKTMVIFKRGAIFLCCIRCDPIPPQTSVQRLAHTRNVTTCCFEKYCHTPLNLRIHLVFWCLSSNRHFETVTFKFLLNPITKETINNLQNTVQRLEIIVFTSLLFTVFR